MKTSSAILMLCASITVACAGSALACGYHPGLTNSAFDVVHPRSLSVAMAIRRAQDNGILRADPAILVSQGFPGDGYRSAVRQLKELEERLARIAPAFNKGGTWHFAFVCVRSRLWARYTVRPDDASAVIHTPPANDSETVVLSDERVLNAIATGRLAFDSAVEQGLLQFANDKDEKVFRILRAALAVEVN